jgi:predicted nuclease with TOPRIM domain
MTYREKINELKTKLMEVYADAEWLRDVATEDEKKYWNELRGSLYSINTPLNRLDNGLSEARASMEV